MAHIKEYMEKVLSKIPTNGNGSFKVFKHELLTHLQFPEPPAGVVLGEDEDELSWG